MQGIVSENENKDTPAIGTGRYGDEGWLDVESSGYSASMEGKLRLAAEKTLPLRLRR